jgi:hypothetical protein
LLEHAHQPIAIGSIAQRAICHQLAAVDGLQQRVVQLARDPGAFGEALVEASAHHP